MFSSSSISKRALHTLGLIGALLLGIGEGRAQLAESRPQPQNNDPFVTYHASLTNAADKALATPVQLSMASPGNNSTSRAAPSETAFAKVSGSTGAISRVQQLRPIIEPILREERVPTELAAIVLIESGGQQNALSPMGARGIWQFMPDTARRYGLAVTPENDERLNVQKSTRAAGRYLRDLHRQFRDWRLAFAAYNAGGEAVSRAIEHNRTRDFSALSHSGSLPLETRKYVPAVINAMKMFGSTSNEIVSTRNAGGAWILYAEARSAD
jgi:hypothetical protein